MWPHVSLICQFGIVSRTSEGLSNSSRSGSLAACALLEKQRTRTLRRLAGAKGRWRRGLRMDGGEDGGEDRGEDGQ